MNNSVQDVLRFERKFISRDLTFKDLERMVLSHPGMFSEIFHRRTVNNIYLDQLGFKAFYDNIDGNFYRTKYRVRWYGDLFGKVVKPVLELKIKRGLMGRKESFALTPFVLEPGFKHEDLNECFRQSKLPKDLLDQLVNLQPVLLNSYERRYFLSKDKKYRITVDSDLKYFRLNRLGSSFLCKYHDKTLAVVELKYDRSDDMMAKDIAVYLDLRLSKNSKFVQGVSHLYQI